MQSINYRILTVSNGCVAVTAPQAAMPPARKALRNPESVSGGSAAYVQEEQEEIYPNVVDMSPCSPCRKVTRGFNGKNGGLESSQR